MVDVSPVFMSFNSAMNKKDAAKTHSRVVACWKGCTVNNASPFPDYRFDVAPKLLAVAMHVVAKDHSVLLVSNAVANLFETDAYAIPKTMSCVCPLTFTESRRSQPPT